jgi:hypothetical protein
MNGLIEDREGEEYAAFIEEGLFDQLIVLLDQSSDELSKLLINATGPFTLPACCAHLLVELNKQTGEEDADRAADAFGKLERLGCCRGLDHFIFVPSVSTCCYAFFLVQPTTSCCSQLVVISLLPRGLARAPLWQMLVLKPS